MCVAYKKLLRVKLYIIPIANDMVSLYMVRVEFIALCLCACKVHQHYARRAALCLNHMGCERHGTRERLFAFEYVQSAQCWCVVRICAVRHGLKAKVVFVVMRLKARIRYKQKIVRARRCANTYGKPACRVVYNSIAIPAPKANVVPCVRYGARSSKVYVAL